MGKPVHAMADLYLAGGHVADLRAGILRRADVAIVGDRIDAVIFNPSEPPSSPPPQSAQAPRSSRAQRSPGPPEIRADEFLGWGSDPHQSARRIIDVTGRVLVPGYIEPHTHIVMANPVEFAAAVLPHGTTTVLADALPLQILARPERLPGLLSDLGTLPVTLRWLIRLHPPAFSDEDRFTLERLQPLWRHPAVAAVGEVTRWTDVLDGSPDLISKIQTARADGKRVDGHAPGASYPKLVALAQAGITSCHEAVTAEEAMDRLRAGLFVMLRHSSIRPDLPALVRAAADPEAVPRIMLTADGPTPAFIAEHGYMDYVVDVAIRGGIPPLTAVRMATLNVAAYYGLDDVGEIIPGVRADLNVLRELANPYPEMVIAGGRIGAGDDQPLPANRYHERSGARGPRPVTPSSAPANSRGGEAIPRDLWEDAFEPLRLPRLPPSVFEPPPGVPACRLQNDVITTLEPGDTRSDNDLQAVLIDRRGRWVTRCLLRGFVRRLGGLATMLNTAFDLLVVGHDPVDMAAAAARVAGMHGGIAIVEAGHELLSLPFDLGPFSSRPWADVVDVNRRFNALMRERGFPFSDPLFTLLFLTFDSLPWIRLTSRGVWDVRNRRALAPAQRLDEPPG